MLLYVLNFHELGVSNACCLAVELTIIVFLFGWYGTVMIEPLNGIVFHDNSRLLEISSSSVISWKKEFGWDVTELGKLIIFLFKMS